MRTAASIATSLALTVSLVTPASASPSAVRHSAAKQPMTFVVSVRALSNVYSAEWATGADALAKWLGYSTANVKVLQSGDNDEAQVTELQTLLSSTSGKVAIVVDPNTNAITQSIVTAVQRDPNAYVTIFWNKPNNLLPWNYSHWVSFINFPGVSSGEQSANVLFQKMGGQGGIIALQGILNNVPAIQRFDGLKAALKTQPKVKLLAQETANWDETQAYNVTKSLIAKYGTQVKGVWAANDEMAVGALQALKNTSMKGVPVVSASDAIPQVLQSIKSGSGIYATTNPDGYWDGSVGLALAYYAATGQINVNALPHAKRAWYAKAGLVTKHNVAGVMAPFTMTRYAQYWSLAGVWKNYVSAM